MSDNPCSSKLTSATPLFIGIDLGTSGCRAVAIDSSHNIKAQSHVHFHLHHHKQTPENWWQATQKSLKDITGQINSKDIQSIAVDGTSSTVLLCDENGLPLTQALMYDEQQAKKQAEYLKNFAPIDSIVLNATSSLAKVLWLNENHKPNGDFFIVHQADWIAGKLSNCFGFSDINNVLKAGFDPVNKIWPTWLSGLFNEVGINKNSLPTVLEPGTLLANIHPRVASDLKLPVKTNIIAGTTDSTASFIASGADEIGQAVTSLGSTLVLKIISDQPVTSTKHGVYSQPYGRLWLVGGASNTGGAVLKHYFSNEEISLLTQQLKPLEQTGLDYYPLVKDGERFPINDATLVPRVTPRVGDDARYFQGLLEGIAEIELNGYKLLHKLGAPYPTSVLTTGGGATNNPWQTIREHKLGVPVTVATHTAAAYGAAKLAATHYIKREKNDQ